MALYTLESQLKNKLRKSRVERVPNLKKYDLKGKSIEEVPLEDKLLEASVNSQSIKDYLVAIRNNARQWSANTKGRSEIAQSNAKPHPQKGTGRARQGCIKAAQYRGGATVFGPKPKFDQHVRINRKERRAAIHYMLAQMISEGHLHLVKLSEIKQPKTKTISSFLKALGIQGKKTLFLCDDQEKTKKQRESFFLSTRNIPKVKCLPLMNVSGYDLAVNQEVVVTDEAFSDLVKVLGRQR